MGSEMCIRDSVGRHLKNLGSTPIWREGFITDNANLIIDTHGLTIKGKEASKLESQINDIPGVVCNGLFSLRPADTLLVATSQGIDTY